MSFFTKSKKSKVCVIGLDGVPYSMIMDLVDKDVLPYLGKLIDSGHLHQMKASLPEISSVSWTDFMTGTNSGVHGIFGFTDFKENSYDMRFPNYNDLKTKTFWDDLAQKKKISIVINQPSTYPARRINGILISGFVALELSKAVYPINLKNQLESIGYQIDIDTMKAREDHNFLWEELYSTLAGRVKAFDLFWKEKWDYFELVITGTDRLMHFLWNAYEDKNHPFHQKFLDYYSEIDKVIEKVAKAFIKATGGTEGLYLLSDHGFTGIKQEVYLNAWLQQKGFLSFKTEVPNNLGDISPDSVAFAMDPNRIYLNLEGKFPSGTVKPAEMDRIKEEIASNIKDLSHEGKKIIHRVFDCSKIYSGPWVSKGPDLITVAEHGYDMKGSIKKKEVFGRSNLKGMHTWNDAFFYASKDHGDDLSISQLAKIIMENFK
ncbi:MAG: alkaline phosphatase family protein [Candidatus Aminicenantes bacterium]|nr:alkaline phosphatase family protein [Candidatus Aminicenantes bacterium]